MAGSEKTTGNALGFSLLEVIIALFLISVGALAFSKMQISSLQTSHDAALRTTALILANDMAGRIQANSADAIKGAASGYLQSGFLNGNCHSSGNAYCDPLQMAINDLAEWQEQIATSLPDGKGYVCMEAVQTGKQTEGCSGIANNFPPVFTVKLFWKSRNSQTRDQSLIATVAPYVQ